MHGRFNRALPPVLTINPGDTVVVQTVDAGWGHRGAQRNGRPLPHLGRDPELDRGHALNGPIFVRGAQPGDVLTIDIMALEPGDWGFTWAGPLPGRHAYTGLTAEDGIDWSYDRELRVWRDLDGLGLSVPSRPFLGVMGNAPAEPGDHPTAPPRRVGGNLDLRELVAGATLWLPIEVEGALFSCGDGHGAQGDGEIGGTAIECPMDMVELRFGVRRDLPLDRPRARTPEGEITLGFGETLDEAAEDALRGMLDLLEAECGMSRPCAAAFASVVVDLRITQIVNYTVGCHAVLPAGARPA